MAVKDKYFPFIVALGLIGIGVVMRILPHPSNFAPITAIAIFGGSALPKKVSIWIPLGAMVLSDAIIGFYPLAPVIWACYLVIALASSRWLRPASISRGVTVTLGASLFFYLVTNFGVWAASGMYAHTWAGLGNCYLLALPFFRNTLLSDMFYTSALFCAYTFATSELSRDNSVMKYVSRRKA